MPSSRFSALLAWAIIVFDALVPAYAVGGQEGLRDARRKERRNASGELRRR